MRGERLEILKPMFKLSADSLDRGYQAVLHHGYSDFFPEPPEFEAVKKGWDKLRTILGGIDLTKYKPFKPVYAFAPKSKINLRPVTLLHPVDLVLYSSLVADLVEHIDDRRIPSGENRFFSFRLEGAPKGALYASSPSHAEFEAEKLRRSRDYIDAYMGFADIADFYPRLYQHKVRGALDSCVESAPKLAAYPGIIERLLRGVSSDNLSYGIPIGPAASRPLAEAALIDIDDALLSRGIDFVRYIDDFVIFAKTREKVEWALRILGELLDRHHGLSLHAAKTKVMRSSNFIKHALQSDSPEDIVESRFTKLIEDHFYDEEERLLDELNSEERKALDAVDLEKILTEALDEDEIDYKKIAFILERLSSLERTDLVQIVLDHLPRLYPVAHAIHSFFRNIEPIELSTRQKSGRDLLAPILATDDEQAPEFYSIWVLNLFGLNPAWNQAKSLGKIFREAQSQAIRRYAAFALSASGGRSEALSFKDSFQSSSDLTRSALLQASRKLGKDERRHWIKRLQLSWFEDFLVEYI
jgi:hypothetical protein